MKNKEELQSFLNNFPKSVEESNKKWKKTYELLDIVEKQQKQIGFKIAALESSYVEQHQTSIAETGHKFYLRSNDKHNPTPTAKLEHKFYLCSNSSNNHNNQCVQTSAFIDEEADNGKQEFKRPNLSGRLS